MTTATLELCNAVIDGGVVKERAEAAAKAVISRSEAEDFASKSDISDLKELIADLRSEMYRALIYQAGFIVAATGLMLAFVG